MRTLRRILEGLRLVDRHDGVWSLTATAMTATTAAVIAHPSIPAAVAMAVAGALYAHKRFQNGVQARHDAALRELGQALEGLKADLGTHSRRVGDLEERFTRELNRGSFRK